MIPEDDEIQKQDEPTAQTLKADPEYLKSGEILDSGRMVLRRHKNQRKRSLPNISRDNRIQKQDEPTAQTLKVDSGHLESGEDLDSEKVPKMSYGTDRRQNQNHVTRDIRVEKQDELTPETLDPNAGHIESRETIRLGLSRFSVHVLNEEDYSVVDSMKLWVQVLTRRSWNWWPLRPVFRQLQEDEVRIRWYCVSSYAHYLIPCLLNL